jgi:hypothetical protein
VICVFTEIKTFLVVCQDALRTYLLRKLDFLGRGDRSQVTMIATWAAELYLDKVLLAMNKIGIAETEYARLIASL